MEGADFAHPPFRLLRPERPFSPVVFTSPHSGSDYSADLMVDVRLPPTALRRSEDCFVDELFEAAPENGAPLLAATFPRAFCDANREAWELDPAMFADPLPDWVNTSSVRVSAGLGTIAKVVASGETIYGGKLAFKEAERRINAYWRPFHAELARLIVEIKDRFGYCLVVDCHSMPSNGQGRRPADFVLGDLHGATCASRVTRFVEGVLQSKHYLVRRNDPYAGGYITRHYGRPAADVHVLQIEIARGLYMDEARFERLGDFANLRGAMTSLVTEVTRQVHDLIG
ncbi:MAG TPA: N-formylglutamate amidohydrolase [Rhodopila sp.]|nr:N-formylglutamate amidohydrolase [Rhodopila sp.]